jgi:uncharacterized protein (DUF924 family)
LEMSYETMMDEAQNILDFWFGTPSEEGIAERDVAARWYRKDAALDREIRSRFLETHLALLRRERESWRDTPLACLAYVVCLDQFSRNMFRETPLAFAADAVALTVARDAIARGHDRALRGDFRAFFYLPLMHSEDLTVQDECIACFEALRDDCEGEAIKRFEDNVEYARRHRDIVARFARFPHRNAILGRSSSQEELAFLEQPGSGF